MTFRNMTFAPKAASRPTVRIKGRASIQAGLCVLALCLAGSGYLFAGLAAGAESSIAITFASWGYGGERVDVVEDVKKYCQDKTSCEFRVGGESFSGKPDPSPGNTKGLIIGWNCNGAEGVSHKYQFAEGKTAKLDCK